MPSQARIHVAGASKRPKLLRHPSPPRHSPYCVSAEKRGAERFSTREIASIIVLFILFILSTVSACTLNLFTLSVFTLKLSPNQRKRGVR